MTDHTHCVEIPNTEEIALLTTQGGGTRMEVPWFEVDCEDEKNKIRQWDLRKKDVWSTHDIKIETFHLIEIVWFLSVYYRAALTAVTLTDSKIGCLSNKDRRAFLSAIGGTGSTLYHLQTLLAVRNEKISKHPPVTTRGRKRAAK